MLQEHKYFNYYVVLRSRFEPSDRVSEVRLGVAFTTWLDPHGLGMDSD